MVIKMIIIGNHYNGYGVMINGKKEVIYDV